MQYRCLLPVPPSTNNLYATTKNGRFRFPTKAYKAWRAKADELELTLPGGFPKGQCWGMVINLGPFRRTGRERGRDIDNAAKAVIDYLAKGCGLEDDHLDYLRIYRSFPGRGEPVPPPGMVQVYIWPMEDGSADLQGPGRENDHPGAGPRPDAVSEVPGALARPLLHGAEGRASGGRATGRGAGRRTA